MPQYTNLPQQIGSFNSLKKTSGLSSYTSPGSSPIYNSFQQQQAEAIDKLKIDSLPLSKVESILQTVLKTNITPFLWGPPGVGKSTLVRNICEKNNYKLIDLRLSLLNPVDLRGLPHLDKTNKTARWLPPSFLPNKNEPTKGILFLDEINLAPLSVQAAAYQLILDKKVGEYEFPPHWKIIAAGNRETDRANVYKMSAPLANRFIHFTISANFKDWKKWAQGKIIPEILEYLSIQEDYLLEIPKESNKAFPSPRSWEFLSNLLVACDFDRLNITDEVKQLIIASIGEPVGKAFIAFTQRHDLKIAKEIVDNFLTTGELNFPSDVSIRWTIIRNIFKARIAGEVDDDRYDFFLSSLTPEERKTVEVKEKEIKK